MIRDREAIIGTILATAGICLLIIYLNSYI
jgi:hypothetical protein